MLPPSLENDIFHEANSNDNKILLPPHLGSVAPPKFKVCYATVSTLVGKFGDCLKIDAALRKIECERAKILTAAGKYINSELCPNLLKVLAISKTLFVSIATVESSFSAMNRILSWARNNLDFSLASDFMLLSMNKDILKRLNLDKML